MISQITKRIAIGEYSDALNLKILQQMKCDYVLNVHNVEKKHSLNYEKFGIRYYWSPIPGDREHTTQQLFKEDFCIAANSLEGVIKSDVYNQILVHCSAGLDRAPAVVAKYLMNVAHLTPHQAYDLIEKQRPEIFRHVDWIQ